MPPRPRPATSQGKHIGHAVEAHCRGIAQQIAVGKQLTVSRTNTLNLPVDTDVVLVDASGRVRAIVIVAYNSDGDDTDRRLDHSSHKFYRSRLEYNEALRARNDNPAAFHPHFVIVTVLYGTRAGWKTQLLGELLRQCAPLLFLPDTLGDSTCTKMVANAYRLYEASRERPSEAVAEHYERATLTGADAKFRLQLEAEIDGGWKHTAAAALRVPPAGLGTAGVIAPFRSRLRQGLSMVSLFRDTEIDAWLSRLQPPQPVSAEAEAFIRRATFLDLVTIQSRKSILGTSTIAEPRRPFDVHNEYQPHRPDFDDWTRVPRGALSSILTAHRALPPGNESFRAGGYDQAFGNYRRIAEICVELTPSLIVAINRGNQKAVAALLSRRDRQVGAEAWHPCGGGEFCFSAFWSVAVAAIATALESRAEFRRYEFRVTAPPSDIARQLSEQLILNKASVVPLFEELSSFLAILLDGPLSALSGLDRPALLDLDSATSWSAAAYLSVTTNPSHNPMSGVVYEWLRRRGLTSLQGFPGSRGVAVSTMTAKGATRIEWTIAGRRGGTVVFAEPRSITANNLGNKSKELYDRIAQTRAAAKSASVNVHLVGVLDGDFDEVTLAEFGSRIGYDEIVSADKVIADTYPPRSP